jgi:CubicO group peptidase (beta-lactamase class C family)
MRGRRSGRAAAFAAALGLAAAATGARAEPAPRALDSALLEAFVDGSVAEGMQADRVAGMAVAVVSGGRVVLAKGYGLSAPERAADADTLFRLGSISKTFTWIALMQLVEQGRLSLDDPVNERLPEVLRIPDEGFAEPIRVRHLMTHSAGFEDSMLGHLFAKDPERLLPASEYLVRYRVHRVRAPGSLAVYSNYGAALAGAVVAHVSGVAFEAYAEEEILRPLGMPSTTFREPVPSDVAAARGLPAPMPPELVARLSQGFERVAGALEAQTTELVGPMAAAGSGSASATDMATYMLALIEPGRMERAGVLRAETALRMREPLFSNLEGLGPLRHGFLDYRLPGCALAFGHDGGLTLAHARLVVCPSLGIGIFLAFNTPGGGSLHSALAARIVGHFFGGEVAKPVYGPDAPAEAAALAGTYLGLRRPYFRSERALAAGAARLRITALPNGDLLLPAFPGQPVQRLVPLGDGHYQTQDGQIEIAAREVGGRMRAFDSIGAMPAERMGLLEGPDGLLAAGACGHLFAIVGGLAFLRGLVSRRAKALPGRGAALALDAAAFVWLVAFTLFVFSLLPGIADPNAVMFDYPGALLPAACNGFAVAALATAVALLAVGLRLRPAGWSPLRWTRQALALAAFAACTLAFARWGLLGFSGW